VGIFSGTQRRATKRAARDGVVFVSRSWQGVFDAPESIPADPRYLADALNVFFPYVEQGGGAWQRPVWSIRNSGQLGSSNTRIGQGIHEHIRADGTIDRLFFLGGKMYSWNGSSTFTDITPAATTISTTARIYCCSFNEKIIVSDGVNQPWSYAPATATRAFINVDTNSGAGTAWVAQGPPVVYAAKLFFIIRSKSSTTYNSRIIWSEEIDETIGYVQTGGGTTYTNKWDLSQTSNDPLTCLLATNVGLYYFRRHSIGFIAGAVNSAFQTTATHDAITTRQGTISPASVIQAHDCIWFLNEIGRPCRFAVGSSTIQDIWLAADATVHRDITGNTLAYLARVGSAVYAPDTNLVLFTIVGEIASQFVHDTSAYRVYVFDGETGSYSGRWSVQSDAAIDVMGAVTDGTGLRVVCAIGTSTSTVSDTTRGNVWRLATTGESCWGDTGTAPYITTRFAAEKPMQEHRFIRAALESTASESPSPNITYTVHVASPSVGSVAGGSAQTTTAQTSLLAGGNVGSVRASVGFNIVGRGLQIRWSGVGTNTVLPHIFTAVEVDAVPLSRAHGGQ
jgi:hypothetical protein